MNRRIASSLVGGALFGLAFVALVSVRHALDWVLSGDPVKWAVLLAAVVVGFAVFYVADVLTER